MTTALLLRKQQCTVTVCSYLNDQNDSEQKSLTRELKQTKLQEQEKKYWKRAEVKSKLDQMINGKYIV